MDNNDERRMFGGQSCLQKAKLDDSYEKWKHPIEEEDCMDRNWARKIYAEFSKSLNATADATLY